MKKLLLFFTVILALTSCSKDKTNLSNGIPRGSTYQTPQTPIAPTHHAMVDVWIDSIPMSIDSVQFTRGNGEMNIICINAKERVEARVFDFYQQNPFSMMYSPQASYGTRTDISYSWNITATYNADVYFDNFTPMDDEWVTGRFNAHILFADKTGINIRGEFNLLFPKK